MKIDSKNKRTKITLSYMANAHHVRPSIYQKPKMIIEYKII